MLAVTTRDKLRRPRFFRAMVRAWFLIRRQLFQTPGMIRYITGIASPTEFYTFTVWESRAAMFNFTNSDRHRQMRWMFTRWSASFWSMRWQPTLEDVGSWRNLKLAEKVSVAEAETSSIRKDLAYAESGCRSIGSCRPEQQRKSRC